MYENGTNVGMGRMVPRWKGCRCDACEIERLTEQRDRLLAAGRRSLNWLASYPGGGALGCYDEMRAAVEPLESVLTKDDDQKATQGPYVPGQERSGKSPETKVSLRCPTCEGPADNGHDREYPPNSYRCSRCVQRDADREDARRYRWLKASHLQLGPDCWIRTGDDLDEAIDAEERANG